MNRLITFLLIIYSASAFAQGTIEAEEVIADSLRGAHIGDGSRLTGLPSQNLSISETGDTLHITQGNFVIIPGISASNSGTAFANAGPDMLNVCETAFNLQAAQPTNGSTGQWSIISGVGGNLVNATLPSALFVGQEGESYLLQWTVNHPGGNSSFDQMNITIAVNTETSVAEAGTDLFAIMTQTITLNGNAPEVGSIGTWSIQSGQGGIIGDVNNPTTTFTGIAGESYMLRWQHSNACSTSSDEVNLTFNEAAAGVPSSNGRYFIPDPKFRQYLQIAYPAVMDGDSLIVANGDQVDKIRITNLGVANLDGIQYLTAFTLFEAQDNSQLTAIPYLSDSLRVLLCDAPIRLIPEFPELLDSIVVHQWQITSLPSFPSNLRDLTYRDGYPLIDLPVLPETLVILNLDGLYRLGYLPTIPESCEIVNISNISGDQYYDPMQDKDIRVSFSGDINIPSSATEYYARSIYGLDNFPILPADKTNLVELQIRNTEISSMPSLYDFTSLDYLSLESNQLLQLDSLPFALQNIDVGGNPLICVKNKPPLVEDQLSQYEICPHN